MNYEEENFKIISYLSLYHKISEIEIIKALECLTILPPFIDLSSKDKWNILNILFEYYEYQKNKKSVLSKTKHTKREIKKLAFSNNPKIKTYKLHKSPFSKTLKQDKSVSCECIGISNNLNLVTVQNTEIQLREPLKIYEFSHKFHKSYFISGNKYDVLDYIYPWFKFWYYFEYEDKLGYIHKYKMDYPKIVRLSCLSECKEKNVKVIKNNNYSKYSSFDGIKFEISAYNRIINTFNIKIFGE